MTKRLPRALITLLLPYLVLVALHLAFSWQRQQPLVFADELGYLGNARYLAGAAHLPDLRQTAFYHFGYSLFLLPAFWLFTDPHTIYRAVMGINALLMSTLYCSVFYIVHSTLQHSRTRASAISFAACLYPAFLLQSSLAWSESAFIPLYALTVVLFVTLLVNPSYWNAVVFGSLTGFLYTIHPRGLPLIPIAVAYVCFLSVTRLLPARQSIASIGMMSAVFIGTRVLNDHLKSMGWGDAGETSILGLLSRLLSLDGWQSWVLEAAGQVLYLSQATYGLFVLGLIAIFVQLWRRRPAIFQSNAASARFHTMLFLVLTSLGVLFASSMAMLSPIRGDHFIYGRYNEGVVGLYIAFALVSLSSPPASRLRAIGQASLVIAAIGALTALVLAGRGSEIASAPVNVVNVLGVFPAVRTLGTLDLATISLVSILLFTALKWTFDDSFSAGIVLLIVLFLYVGSYGRANYFAVSEERASEATRLVSEIGNLGGVQSVSYDMTFYRPGSLFSYQYLLQDVVFNRFYSGRGETPQSAVVIASTGWSDAEALGAQFIARENELNGIDHALWVLPSGPQQAIPGLDLAGNLTVGVAPVRGVWESGFHQQEGPSDRPLRWTNGAAKLVVPVDDNHPPQTLHIALASTGPEGTRLQVIVNGQALFDAKLPAGGWARTFRLSDLPVSKQLTVELRSGTFIPRDIIKGSRDPRTLGVRVQAIRLLASDQPITGGPLAPGGYRSQLRLAEPRQQVTLAAAQRTTVPVIVKNVAASPWPTPGELRGARGSVRLGIIWFAPGQSDARLAEHRAELPYTMFPGDEVETAVPLTPLGYDGSPLPPGAYEVWLGLVQEGITWFYQEGDDVLKLQVRATG